MKRKKNNQPKYKVLRVFGVAQKDVRIRVIIFAFLVVSAIFKVNDLTEWLIVLVIDSLLLWHFLKKHKLIVLRENTICYKEKMFFLMHSIRFLRSAKVEFTVSDITSLELKQTRFERFFNVGHIQIEGRTDFITKEKFMERVPDRDQHIVHGIRNFSKFCQDCQARDRKSVV